MKDTLDVRQALETRLSALPNRPPIAWENVNFNVPAGPYIQSNILFAAPDDFGFKDAPFLQRGFMQVTLHYPTNNGPGAAHKQAEDIRDWFNRGSSVVDEQTVVNITNTPEISGGAIEGGRFVVRVTIRFVSELDPRD